METHWGEYSFYLAVPVTAFLIPSVQAHSFYRVLAILVLPLVPTHGEVYVPLRRQSGDLL